MTPKWHLWNRNQIYCHSPKAFETDRVRPLRERSLIFSHWWSNLPKPKKKKIKKKESVAVYWHLKQGFCKANTDLKLSLKVTAPQAVGCEVSLTGIGRRPQQKFWLKSSRACIFLNRWFEKVERVVPLFYSFVRFWGRLRSTLIFIYKSVLLLFPEIYSLHCNYLHKKSCLQPREETWQKLEVWRREKYLAVKNYMLQVQNVNVTA